MTKNTLKTVSIALLAPVTLTLASCDDSDDSSNDGSVSSGSDTPVIDTTESVLPASLNTGDRITLTFSGGDSSITGDILSDSLVRYTFRFGSDTIDIGSVPYIYGASTDARRFVSQPNTLRDSDSVTAINNTILRNSRLQNLLAQPNLTNDQKRLVTALVNESTSGVTISFDGDFFLVESAALTTLGTSNTGTFIESGSTLQFSSSSASLTGGETIYEEYDVVVTFQ